MSRTYKLSHFNKGTGATVEPLDDDGGSASTRRLNTVALPRERRTGGRGDRTRLATPLPPGHVRKRATGEIGRVQAVDARTGTATVMWLREGRTSSVPLSALSRS